MKAFVSSLVALGFYFSASAQTIEWETVHPYPGLSALRSVAAGEGGFVAAGEGGLYYSEDAGATWLEGIDEPAMVYNGVTYANGRFVAVGNSGQVAVSDDGRMWSSQAIGSNDGLLAITFSDGLYVATGNNGLIATSADATNWTVRPTGMPNALRLAVHGNGQFLATDGVVYNSMSAPGWLDFAVSTNGVNWEKKTVAMTYTNPDCVPSPGVGCTPFHSFDGLIFDGERFVALAFNWAQFPGFADMRVLTSGDGESWEIKPRYSVGSASQLLVALVGNGLGFVNDTYVNLSAAVMTTNVDADPSVAWEQMNLPYSPQEFFGGPAFEGLAYDGTNFVMVGKTQGGWARIGRGTSLTGLSRVDVGGGLGAPNNVSVAVNGTTMVAVGNGGELQVSNDGGRNFTRLTPPPETVKLVKAAFAQGNFVAVGGTGTIIRSANGTDWSKRLSNTSRDLKDIAFGNGVWVAVGLNGAIVTSSDASFFTLRDANTEVNLRAITFGDGQFVAVGDTGAILRSPDGINWTIFGTDEALNLRGVAFDNGLFVAVGANGIVHYSTNAINWNSTTIPNEQLLADVAGANGLFVTVRGLDPGATAYVSRDGATWQAETFPKALYGTDSSGGDLFVGGEFGYIARAVESEAGMRVSASVQETEMRLTFVAEPGTYEIVSKDNLTGSWDATFPLGERSGRVTFADPRPVSGNRFYQVRKLP